MTFGEIISYIAPVLGGVIGGGTFMHYKTRAKQEKNSAKKGEFEILQQQIEFQGTLIKNFQNDAMLKDDRIVKLEKENEEIKFLQREHERKLLGIQKLLTREVGNKRYAEKHICFQIECDNRKPPLGEFHTEDPEMIEIENDV